METQEVWIVVLAAIVAVSEAMALSPMFKDNGIIQFIIRMGKKLLPKKKEDEVP